MKLWFGTPGWGWRLWGVSSGDKWFFGLSIKQGASHDSENVAEIEALRAEVERVTCELMDAITRADKLEDELREAREFRDKMANAIGNDQLRRFIEKHGEPVPLTIRMQAAEARAERLAEALEDIRSRSCMNLAMNPNPYELTALLGDIHQIACAALAQEDDQ